jgi:hypothetical protein
VGKLYNILNTIVEEKTFQDVVGKKNQWVELDDSEKNELKVNLYQLISNAYDTRFEGGHPRIFSPEDVKNDPDLKFWRAADIDEDPMADVVVFGRYEHGTKLSGIGHENTTLTKTEVMKHSAEILKQDGFWIEVSGKVADRLLELGCPYLDNPEDVVKVLNNKPIDKWLGDGWYERPITYFKNEWGDVRQKMIIGRPKI